jgi:uncharacterized protein (DUF302 family)
MDTTRFYVEHIRLTTDRPFDTVRVNFERQLGKFDPEAVKALGTGQSAESTKTKLNAMVGPSGFMLFATQDHGTLLMIVGLKRKAIQYVVGNPLYALQMTQYSLGAGLYAPLRVLLYENDAGKVCIEYDRPSSLFAQFSDDHITQVAASLDKKLEDLVAQAMK